MKFIFSRAASRILSSFAERRNASVVVDNLFDKRYQVVEGYSLLGRDRSGRRNAAVLEIYNRKIFRKVW
ncbi:MAG: hypothetical protein ACR2MG_13150 [Pyrinomonadaceae bacterium]